MSKLEVNAIDSVGSTLTLGDTNATTLALNSGITTLPSSLKNTPAFTAYMSSNQSISNSTLTTIAFQSEKFDTDNCYDTSTYRFTPTVAGKYCFFINVRFDLTGDYNYDHNLEIRHSVYNSLFRISGSQRYQTSYSGSVIIEMNGTTDYVYATMWQTTGSARNLDAGDGDCKFGGYKLIGA